LIVCHISGFGHVGPWAEAAAYDQIVQGFAGIMSLTGPAGVGGQRVGASIADVATDLFAVSAVLAALRAREHDADGSGTIIEVSLLASLLNVLGYQAAAYQSTGNEPAATGNHHTYIAPYGTYRGADRQFNLCVGNDAQFGRLCKVLELPEIAKDPRFANNTLRVRNRDELDILIEPVLRRHPVEEWIKVMQSAGIPCGPVHSLSEALAHPQTQALDLVLEIERENGARFAQLGSPFKSSGWETDVRFPPPLLGEHTEEVLSELRAAEEHRS
jgi:crotonobetainyl-CoA:carnitine CoA-transferase CaiB-like acyl-CoA transferase